MKLTFYDHSLKLACSMMSFAKATDSSKSLLQKSPPKEAVILKSDFICVIELLNRLPCFGGFHFSSYSGVYFRDLFFPADSVSFAVNFRCRTKTLCLPGSMSNKQYGHDRIPQAIRFSYSKTVRIRFFFCFSLILIKPGEGVIFRCLSTFT